MSTPTIKIAVSQADATLVQTCTLTAGMVNVPVVKFTFTDEWAGLGKTAVVRAGSEVLEVLVVNNQITVPVECLATAGVNLIVGIYGTDTSIAIPTVWCAVGEILDGTDVTEASNEGTATENLVDQMLAYAEEIESISDTLDTYAFRTVTVNTTGANAYGIASVSLSDTGAGDNRTLTFTFTNLKGNGIESITWSASGTYKGRIQITQSNGTVTNFDALVDAIAYLDSLTNLSEAYAKGTVDDVPVSSGDPGYHDNAKYYSEQAAASAEAAALYVAHSPIIDDDTGNWELWDDDDQQYVVSDYPSRGEQGETGATGATGPVPVMTATATGLGTGESPTVSVTGSGTVAEPYNLALGIPKGDNGQDGAPGESGVYIGSTEPADPNINVWIDTSGSADVAVQSSTVTHIWTGTQAAYDLIDPKDAHTLYFITESSS